MPGSLERHRQNMGLHSKKIFAAMAPFPIIRARNPVAMEQGKLYKREDTYQESYM